MARKTRTEIEKELREWSDQMQRKGSNVRFVDLCERKPLALSQTQKAELKRFSNACRADSKARAKSLGKRKAA